MPQSALALPAQERELVELLARTPWYSLRATDATEQGRKCLRVAALTVRADRVVRIESLDIQLRDNHEAFRIHFSVVDNVKTGQSSSMSRALAGGRGSILEDLHLLPHPKLSLVWQELEYPVSQAKDSDVMRVTVPDGLLIQGNKGRLLVYQDELPTWLRVEWEDDTVEGFLERAPRIDLVS